MARRHRGLNKRRWAAVRVVVLKRDGWKCCECGKYGRMEIDHRVSLEHGGAAYDLSNLQALCRL